MTDVYSDLSDDELKAKIKTFEAQYATQEKIIRRARNASDRITRLMKPFEEEHKRRVLERKRDDLGWLLNEGRTYLDSKTFSDLSVRLYEDGMLWSTGTWLLTGGSVLTIRDDILSIDPGKIKTSVLKYLPYIRPIMKEHRVSLGSKKTRPTLESIVGKRIFSLSDNWRVFLLVEDESCAMVAYNFIDGQYDIDFEGDLDGALEYLSILVRKSQDDCD